MRYILKITFLIILFLGINSKSNSQDNEYSSESSITDSTRFEIVESSILARDTYLINRFSGDVYIITQDSEGSSFWRKIPRREHYLDLTQNKQVNYSLFLSKFKSAYTYLINLNTGLTWQLAEDSDGNLLFSNTFSPDL